MLQQDTPVATLVSLLYQAFRASATSSKANLGVNMDLEWHGTEDGRTCIERQLLKLLRVRVNPTLFAVRLVELVIGDPAKAKAVTG